MTTVYLQQQHNLHLASAQQPVLSLSPSRALELEESRVVRSSPVAFANCGNIDSRFDILLEIDFHNCFI